MHRVLAAVGLALTALVLLLRRLDDWDLPWHLATGRIIVATRSIPRIDDLAFTHGVLKYTEVVSDVALYLLMRAGGPLALQILNGVLVAALAVLLHRRGAFDYVVIGVVLITIAPWQYVRPATISLVFIAAVFVLLEKRRLYWLIPLQLLWANTHGYAPIGVMLIWLFALTDRKRDAFIAAAGATLATMVSTAGPRLLIMVRRFDEDLVGISEWMRPTPAMLWQASPAVYLLLALLMGAMIIRRPTCFEAGVLLIATALLVTAIRFVPVFAVMVTPFVCARLQPRLTKLTELACALAALIPPFVIAFTLEPLLGVGWYAPHFPEQAVRFIEEKKLAGNMWNFMPFGGYLAWRLHPQHRVFMDGRNALARERTWVTRARLSISDSAEFEFLTRDLDMQWAVVCTIQPHCKGFSAPLAGKEGWKMVFLDDVAAIYVRGPNASIEGYRAIHHLTTPAQMLEMAKTKDLSHDGALAVAQAPNSVRAVTFQAIGALSVRDEKAFRAAVARLPGETAGVLIKAWDGRDGIPGR
jgi:hypothetical protein